MPARSRILVAVILCAVALPGCVPGVAWFPDSKKFAFSDFSDPKAVGCAFVTYDLDGKTRSTLVRDTRTRTLWPAISPDGKRLAAARWQQSAEGKPSELQVIFYKLDGSEDRRSRVFDWDASPSGRTGQLDETYLHWNSPTHLLVMANRAAIYDIDRDRILAVDGFTPWLWGGSPVRPDGKGFLATRDTRDGDADLLFVSWNGESTKLGNKAPDEKALGSVPYLHWDGNTAYLIGARSTLRIDTVKKTVVKSPTRGPLPLDAPGELICWHRFPDNNLSLCSFRYTDPNDTTGRHVERLEIHDSAKKTRTVLAGPFTNIGPFIPSPDGLKVAIRPRLLGPGGAVLVVGSAGKILGELAEKSP